MASVAHSRRPPIGRWVLAAGWAIIAISFSEAAFAQAPLQPDPSLKVHQFAVTNALANKQIPAALQQTFDDYFNKYVLVEFGRPENRNDLPRLRKELRTKYFLRGKSGAPYAQLNKLTLTAMKPILVSRDKNIDDVMKVNAMLVVADLNKQEQEGQTKAQPLPEAFTYLIAPLTSNSKLFTDQLRIAAMVGLLRHAESGTLAASNRARLTSAMLELIKQEDPPQGQADARSDEGHAWIRMRAAEILGAIGDAGPNGSIALAVSGALANPDKPLFMRREMARALGRMRYPQGFKGDVVAMANEVGWLAHDACRNEVDSFKRAQVLAQRAGNTVEGLPSSRRLRHHLYAIRIGLVGPNGDSGLKAAGNPTQDAFIDKLAAAVNDLIATAESKRAGSELAAEIEANREPLEKLLKPRAKQPTRIEEQEPAEAPGVARAADRNVRVADPRAALTGDR